MRRSRRRSSSTESIGQDPNISVSLNGLGASLQSLERCEEAKRVLQRSVDMHRSLAGALKHPSAAVHAEVAFALLQSEVEAKLRWREDAKLAREAFVAMDDAGALKQPGLRVSAELS